MSNKPSKTQQIVTELAASYDIKLNGKRSFDIQVHDPSFYRRVLSGHGLGAGEAYMDGLWSSNQLDETIAHLPRDDVRDHLPFSPSFVWLVVREQLTNLQNRARASHHATTIYNLGNDLYEATLDKRLMYTCGFWQKARNVDEAQEAKIDRICQKLQLKKGMTVLDIGCGWGGFAEYAARNYGVKVTGVTLASEQAKVARQRTKGLPVTILEKDYRELTGQYDRIVSIGLTEHIGHKNYRTFFDKCRELLKDGGIMLHQMIGTNHPATSGDPWIRKYIFPGGYLPTLSQINQAVEDRLVIEDLENLGPDYDKTLMAWHKNFVKNYPQLKDKYDERFYRMWEYYLLSCAGAFRARRIQLWQIVMRKIERSEAYRGYR